MAIQRKMANVLRILKDKRGKSMTEFSEELEISRSTLQEYLSGTGNPHMATVEHMAEKLGVSASFLLFAPFSENQLNTLAQLLDILSFLSNLTSDRRQKFAELLLEMVLLWNGDGGNGETTETR